MNRKEIRDMTRRRLGETQGVFWSDDELNSWIQQAANEIAFKTKSIRSNGLMTTTSEEMDYIATDHFTGIIAILELYYNISTSASPNFVKLEAFVDGRTQMDLEYPGWMNAPSGTPHKYGYDREENNLWFFPKPNATFSGTDKAKVFYARDHAVMANDTATSILPNVLHLAIVDWTTSLGYESRGYGDKANDAMSKANGRMREYMTERKRQKEDEELLMRPYKSY